MRLDEFIKDDETRILLVSTTKKVVDRIKSFGAVVPGDYLNRVKTFDDFDIVDIPSAQLHEIVTRFNGLIDWKG